MSDPTRRLGPNQANATQKFMFSSWHTYMTDLGLWRPWFFGGFGKNYQRASFDPGFAWTHNSAFDTYPHESYGIEYLGCPSNDVIEEKTQTIRKENPKVIKNFMPR